MAISHSYWHVVVRNGNFTLLGVVRNGNFTLLMTARGQKWQFHIATDNYNSGQQWQTLAISHCYWHGNFTFLLTVVGNGNFTLLLTFSGQERQFHIATDMLVVRNGNFTLLLTWSGQEWHFTLLQTARWSKWQFHIATDISWSTVAISHCY